MDAASGNIGRPRPGLEMPPRACPYWTADTIARMCCLTSPDSEGQASMMVARPLSRLASPAEMLRFLLRPSVLIAVFPGKSAKCSIPLGGVLGRLAQSRTQSHTAAE